MKKRLTETAAKAGIDDIGFTAAEVYDDLCSVLEKRKDVVLTRGSIDERTNPFLIMPEAKTIIVCLMSYYTGSKKGDISKYARGLDYHRVMGDALCALCGILKENGFLAREFCDNGSLNDRYLAHRAGLGFFGKNSLLIHPTLGSYTFIGYILTDCEIEPDQPMENGCIGCNRCIEACPAGAISDGFGFDDKKCVSYLTQKKGELSEDEKRSIKKSGYVWGCDICQDVCPHNKNAKKTNNYSFSESLVESSEDICANSNREFKKLYKNRAFSWRGKTVIDRNIKIFLDKSNKNDE